MSRKYKVLRYQAIFLKLRKDGVNWKYFKVNLLARNIHEAWDLAFDLQEEGEDFRIHRIFEEGVRYTLDNSQSTFIFQKDKYYDYID